MQLGARLILKRMLCSPPPPMAQDDGAAQSERGRERELRRARRPARKQKDGRARTSRLRAAPELRPLAESSSAPGLPGQRQMSRIVVRPVRAPWPCFSRQTTTTRTKTTTFARRSSKTTTAPRGRRANISRGIGSARRNTHAYGRAGRMTHAQGRKRAGR